MSEISCEASLSRMTAGSPEHDVIGTYVKWFLYQCSTYRKTLQALACSVFFLSILTLLSRLSLHRREYVLELLCIPLHPPHQTK